MRKLKSKDNKAILYPTKLDHPLNLIQLIPENFFGEVEDHTFIDQNYISKKYCNI